MNCVREVMIPLTEEEKEVLPVLLRKTGEKAFQMNQEEKERMEVDQMKPVTQEADNPLGYEKES